MKLADSFRFSLRALTAHKLRTGLSAGGIAVGIAAIILLTAIGEGIHQFVLAEFTQFGTHIVNVTPGKTQTHGVSVGSIGATRPITLDDVEALRAVPNARFVNGGVTGNAEVRVGNKGRRVMVNGEGPDFSRAFSMEVAIGNFLPPDNPDSARAFAVLGSKVRTELFGIQNPLGAVIQVGGLRFRVIGVMASKGQVLGFDLDDTVYIPTARALELFNREGVMEAHVVYRPGTPVESVVENIRRIMLARHGREDFTVTPQQQMLSTLSTVLDVLTFAVAALGGISLLVGAVGIITLMHISVNERVSEIGLLKALGATRAGIRSLFLIESAGLSLLGGIIGLAVGGAIAWLLQTLLPALPVQVPWVYVSGALVASMLIGLGAGVAPAWAASRLDPVESLRTE
jgi:putative ABC transport system permease protein